MEVELEVGMGREQQADNTTAGNMRNSSVTGGNSH